jgi:membrane-associated phospholipid phosphatase
LIAATFLVAPAAARAQQADEVAWQPHWRKVHPLGLAAAGVFSAAAIGTVLLVDQRSSGARGGVLFDGGVRDALRADTRSGRDRARLIGDLGYRTMLVFPLLDVGLSWAIHGNDEVALQMLGMDFEVIAFAGFVGILTDHAIGRARPSVGPCDEDHDYERFCNESDQFGSFLSGHTIMATAHAAVTCAHHVNLPLYGGGAGDVAACAAASAFALTTGIARIVNDRHWATDVTTAWLLGGAIGYLWPVWYHYRDAPRPGGADGARLFLLPALDGRIGAHVFGTL